MKDELERVMDEAETNKTEMAEVGKNLDKIQLNLDDEIDLEGYTYRENFSETIKLQSEVTFVPVKRPDSQSWIYISSKPEMRANVAILELKQLRETYLVRPEVAASLDGEVTNRLLVPYQDREGGLFIWAVKLSDSRGNLDSWTLSALRVVTEYTDKWIKVKAKMSAGCYEVIIAPGAFPSPEWPADGLRFLVNKAFKNRTINSSDDPVIKKLRGII